MDPVNAAVRLPRKSVPRKIAAWPFSGSSLPLDRYGEIISYKKPYQDRVKGVAL